MKVTGVFIYPIKSCRGIELEQAEVTPKGFAWDREFMIVDERGKFITQRQYSSLAKLEVNLDRDAIALAIEDGSLEPLQFKPTLAGQEIEVEIWRDRTTAIDQGDEVANWLKIALTLQGNFRLVRQSPQHLRPVNPNYAIQGNESVSFADGYPFLLTNTASLEDLNRRLDETHPEDSQTLPMNRFRPNIVVETNEPFAEDNWDAIQIGDAIFDLVKPCDRCIITTTDQTTGERNERGEPLKTLNTFRKFSQQGILFGENMIPRNIGSIKVGDHVEVLDYSVS
jgi:uncharacterized protein